MPGLVKTETQVPANPGDPYSEYGRAVSSDTPFLKYVKGEFRKMMMNKEEIVNTSENVLILKVK